MPTLYVDRRHARLSAADGAVTVHVADERPVHVPLATLDRLVVRGEATLTTGLVAALWRQGAGLLVLAGRRGEPVPTLLGPLGGDARLRLAQYELARDPARRLGLARELVAGKLRGQRRLLERLREERPKARLPLTRGIERLRSAEQAIDGAAAIDRLMGVEGAGAAAFFEAFAALLAPSLGFVGRRRRPPPDPVNAALSLGYTLLTFEAGRAAQRAGLDPLLGFYHAPAAGRASLACDLVEPLRCHVEAFVLELFAERTLRAAHFGTEAGACLLGKVGRELFYIAWEQRAAPLGRLLRRMAADLQRMLRALPLPLEVP